MKYSHLVWTALACGFLGCGPDAKPQQTCAGEPDFVVTVSSALGPLPEDTLVSVTFGGDGHETYQPNAHNERQVLFCESTRVSEPGAGGAGGAASQDQLLAGAGGAHPITESTIESISCELWSGGPAHVTVVAGALQHSAVLTPHSDVCTTWSAINLDADEHEP
ncbi:MAG: hypothetical protein QM756_28595 [Polyangiaceae bacterium]